MVSGRARKPGPPRQSGTEGERTWSVDDALRQYHRVVRWFGTGDGVRGAYLAYHTHYGGHWPAGLADPAQRWAVAERTARDTAEAFAECDLIWCDPPMVDLLAAAADTYPAEPLTEHHLLAPDGIVILAKPLPAIWRDQETGDETAQRISAISWATSVSTDGQPLLGVTAWQRGAGLFRFRDPALSISYPGLRTLSYGNGPFGAEPSDQGGPAGPHRILQAFTALCRTPLVRHETAPSPTAARGTSAAAGPADPPIRRVYLRRPEHGAAELQAAREARAGRPPRGHWVKGHWKDQWYPGQGKHHAKWIAGYPRGDFAAGTVGGTKVLIAHDRTPPPTSRPPDGGGDPGPSG